MQQASASTIIDRLNKPVLNECSVYMYKKTDDGGLIFLSMDFEANFGGKLAEDDSDYSIVYTCARNMLQKTGCLIGTKRLTKKEYDFNEVAKQCQDRDFFVENFQFVQEIFYELYIEETCATDLLSPNHFLLFYPLPSTFDEDLSLINEILTNSGYPYTLKWTTTIDESLQKYLLPLVEAKKELQ